VEGTFGQKTSASIIHRRRNIDFMRSSQRATNHVVQLTPSSRQRFASCDAIGRKTQQQQQQNITALALTSSTEYFVTT